MQMMPKNFKYKKLQKKKIKHSEWKSTNTVLQYGNYGIQALENGRITPKQIEAVRRIIIRKTAKSVKLWIKLFPNIPITQKPEAVRMGKGKGAVSYWACNVKKGMVLFEISGISNVFAKTVLQSASTKLPIITQFINI